MKRHLPILVLFLICIILLWYEGAIGVRDMIRSDGVMRSAFVISIRKPRILRWEYAVFSFNLRETALSRSIKADLQNPGGQWRKVRRAPGLPAMPGYARAATNIDAYSPEFARKYVEHLIELNCLGENLGINVARDEILFNAPYYEDGELRFSTPIQIALPNNAQTRRSIEYINSIWDDISAIKSINLQRKNLLLVIH